MVPEASTTPTPVYHLILANISSNEAKDPLEPEANPTVAASAVAPEKWTASELSLGPTAPAGEKTGGIPGPPKPRWGGWEAP